MRKVLHVRPARKHLRRSARARSSHCPCPDARSFNRYPARARDGADGAGPCPRFLHQRALRSARSLANQRALVSHALGHALLRADVRAARWSQRLSHVAAVLARRAESIPLHARPVAGGARSDAHQPGLDLQRALRPRAVPASHLGDRRFDGGARIARALADARDRALQLRRDLRTQLSRQHPAPGPRRGVVAVVGAARLRSDPARVRRLSADSMDRWS